MTTPTLGDGAPVRLVAESGCHPSGLSAGRTTSDLVRRASGAPTSTWCAGFRRLAFRALVAAVAAATTGCGAPRHSAIVMVVDTLRADHMSLYGYPRATTPEIEGFARDAVVFERTRSQAACTFPSVNSLLTSRDPTVFLFQGVNQLGIPDQFPTLAGLLQDHGWTTVAVSANPIVRKTPSRENPNGGFDRGFAVFDEVCEWRSAACVNERALEHLRTVDEPFFLYLHYMEPHDPYRPPDEYQRRFAGAYEGQPFIANGNPNPIADMIYGDGPAVDFGARDLAHLVDLYDDEVAYFDQEFARFIAALDERGLLDSTLLVLASDHGEEFMEHGHLKHCRALYDASTRTPLVMRVPGLAGGHRVGSAVQNVDIAPTVLDYLGVEWSGLGLTGQSLRPLIEGRPAASRLAFSNQGRYRSVDDARTKVILDGVDQVCEMYDLYRDPGELDNVFDPQSATALELLEALEAKLAVTENLQLGDSLEAARVKEEQLRALGYLQ